jgi:hypothetical protein
MEKEFYDFETDAPRDLATARASLLAGIATNEHSKSSHFV